jgi:hypothetical protein
LEVFYFNLDAIYLHLQAVRLKFNPSALHGWELSMRGCRDVRIKTWFREEDEEEGMLEDHADLWKRLINAVGELDYSQMTVCDYGCNRGGFLKALFQCRGFKRGIDIDIAEFSLAIAASDSLSYHTSIKTIIRATRTAGGI